MVSVKPRLTIRPNRSLRNQFVRASDDAIAFEGKVLVFDASREHSVANTCNVPRAVLQVVLWHPDAPDRPV